MLFFFFNLSLAVVAKHYRGSSISSNQLHFQNSLLNVETNSNFFYQRDKLLDYNHMIIIISKTNFKNKALTTPFHFGKEEMSA